MISRIGAECEMRATSHHSGRIKREGGSANGSQEEGSEEACSQEEDREEEEVVSS
jgi:hypothetical protein